MSAAPALRPRADVDRDPAPPGLVEGYASLFDVPDLGGDIVAPGAFRESLARRAAGEVRMLWQHDPAQPIGRWLSLVEDGRGLRVSGRLNLQVARAAELEALVRQGAVDGLSIGFRVVEARRGAGAGARRLLRVDLWEVSLVTFPMLPGARLGGSVRGLASAPSTRPLAGAIRRATARFTNHPRGTL